MNVIPNANERVLKLEGAFNVRDLGGYKAADGRTTQWGRVFRADTLHKLSEQDQQELLCRRIYTIVDLRRANEIEKMKNVFADSKKVEYHNVNMFNPATATRETFQNLGDMYVHMLDEFRPEIRRVFELLADTDKEPVLFHCTAGKDRTGMIAGLLLELAGVSRETIIDDYAMTADCIAPLIEELRSIPVKLNEKFLGSEREHMARLLDHLQAGYGGSERYLLSAGLKETQLTALKRKLLEP